MIHSFFKRSDLGNPRLAIKQIAAFVFGYGFRPFMLIHTDCTKVPPCLLIIRRRVVQHCVDSYLPLWPPLMFLVLPFSQSRFYPSTNFWSCDYESWHDNLPTYRFIGVLCSPLRFPSQVSRWPRAWDYTPAACYADLFYALTGALRIWLCSIGICKLLENSCKMSG